ncbi:uncharacterized protein LOC101674437 [Mustela putorius furo]|uniref:Uncharacterized protein LOC101674437 n=1 Tax=Mustela putorius furo TaxID=9669 RepID=A0A8U0MZ15_MUSPF|nr:uncharacterized protein LOC101674437 [Mustela putorius furo]
MGMSHPRSPFPIPRWTTCVWLRRQKVTSNRRIRGHNGQRLACNRQPQAKRAPPGASPAWAPQSTHLACWTPEVDQTQDAQGCERPRPSRGSRLAMATGDHTPATHLPSAPRAQHPEILMPGFPPNDMEAQGRENSMWGSHTRRGATPGRCLRSSLSRPPRIGLILRSGRVRSASVHRHSFRPISTWTAPGDCLRGSPSSPKRSLICQPAQR